MQDARGLGGSLTRTKSAPRAVARALPSRRAISVGASNARAVAPMVRPGEDGRGNRWALLADLCRDVSARLCGLRTTCRAVRRCKPAGGRGQGTRRPKPGRNRRSLRSDSSGVVRLGTRSAGPRRNAPILAINAGESRTRLSLTVERQLGDWLRRVVHVHAQLRHTVAVYDDPTKAGGGGEDDYSRRAAEGDRTILDDTLARAIEELSAIRDEIGREMEAVPPSSALPGSLEKIAQLALRAAAGMALHHPNDVRVR